MKFKVETTYYGVDERFVREVLAKEKASPEKQADLLAKSLKYGYVADYDKDTKRRTAFTLTKELDD